MMRGRDGLGAFRIETVADGFMRYSVGRMSFRLIVLGLQLASRTEAVITLPWNGSVDDKPLRGICTEDVLPARNDSRRTQIMLEDESLTSP